MQLLVAAFGYQFHQFLIVQRIKHFFVQFCRNTIKVD